GVFYVLPTSRKKSFKMSFFPDISPDFLNKMGIRNWKKAYWDFLYSQTQITTLKSLSHHLRISDE
ncbi:MAG: hypothetical protein ACOZCO_03585, partial [Bacteroidota bacterium]